MRNYGTFQYHWKRGARFLPLRRIYFYIFHSVRKMRATKAEVIQLTDGTTATRAQITGMAFAINELVNVVWLIFRSENG